MNLPGLISLVVSLVVLTTLVTSSDCETWSVWYDADDPTGDGDFETPSVINNIYGSYPCGNENSTIYDIECRDVATGVYFDDYIYSVNIDSVKCDTTGYVCRNSDTHVGVECPDFEVRYCCQDQESGTATETPTTSLTTPTTTTTVTKIITTQAISTTHITTNNAITTTAAMTTTVDTIDANTEVPITSDTSTSDVSDMSDNTIDTSDISDTSDTTTIIPTKLNNPTDPSDGIIETTNDNSSSSGSSNSNNSGKNGSNSGDNLVYFLIGISFAIIVLGMLVIGIYLKKRFFTGVAKPANETIDIRMDSVDTNNSVPSDVVGTDYKNSASYGASGASDNDAYEGAGEMENDMNNYFTPTGNEVETVERVNTGNYSPKQRKKNQKSNRNININISNVNQNNNNNNSGNYIKYSQNRGSPIGSDSGNAVEIGYLGDNSNYNNNNNRVQQAQNKRFIAKKRGFDGNIDDDLVPQARNANQNITPGLTPGELIP